MKRLLSAIAAVMLLLGLGAIVVLALPDANTAPAAVAPAAMAAAPFAQDQPVAAEALAAPSVGTRFNVIALPLDSSAQFAAQSLSYTASGLAAYVGSGVQQVLHWDTATQTYEFYFPADGFGTDFSLQTGGVYWIEVDSTTPPVLSFVGDVPAQGTIQFDLLGATTCLWNDISLPLDKSDITVASQLAASIGDVEQIVRWDPETQTYEFYFPADGFGTDFSTRIGYPYHVCLTQGKLWPQ